MELQEWMNWGGQTRGKKWMDDLGVLDELVFRVEVFLLERHASQNCNSH